MTTPPTTKIDVPYILWRINPEAEYHWKAGGWGTYADIGQWRSPHIPKPTEAEVYAEWDRWLDEKEHLDRLKNGWLEKVRYIANGATGKRAVDLDADGLLVLVVALLDRAGGLTLDGVVKPLEDWGQ